MASSIARRAFGRPLPLPRHLSVAEIGSAAGALASGCGAGGLALTNCTSCRRNHSEASTDSDASTEESHSADGEDKKDTLQQQSTDRRPQSDPTARRPTQKCDPYGLQGASLTFAECRAWLPTLDDGWRLIPPEGDAANPQNGNADSEATGARPVYLQRQYHHPTLHDATQFLTRIGLLATNLNHYPFLSVERVLVDDIRNMRRSDKSGSECSNDGGKKRRRKVKGWVFRSTVRCATYRPPVAGTPMQTADGGGADEAKGLTYHDFHLAMSVDVEVAREEVRRLLCERTTNNFNRTPTKNPTEADSLSDVTVIKAEELSTLLTTIEEQKKEIEEQKKENSKLQATVDEQKAQLEEAARSDEANREAIASYLLANADLAMQLGAEERRKARYKAQKAAMQAQIESLKQRVETEAQGKAEFQAEYIRVRDGFVGYVNDMRPIIKKFQKNGSHTFDFVE